MNAEIPGNKNENLERQKMETIEYKRGCMTQRRISGKGYQCPIKILNVEYLAHRMNHLLGTDVTV